MSKTNKVVEHTVLVVDDDEDIRLALSILLKQQGYRVVEAASPFECERVVSRLTPDVILLDMNFSRDTTSGEEGLKLLTQLQALNRPVILMTAWANVELVVKGMRLGAADFIEKPWHKPSLLNSIQAALNKNQAVNNDEETWVANSDRMQAINRQIEQIAKTDANILILGENGTGKSMLAKRIHQKSERGASHFIPLNMAAIAESLFESELFGHKKGAFTDAKQDRVGAFERANSGTLFMDEIGTLPLKLQAKLLQVLESGDFMPLGGSEALQTDARLISATNSDLQAMTQMGEFRQDLFYRLNTFVITMPPLRERKSDIDSLIEVMAKKVSLRYGLDTKTFSNAACEKLRAHSWPGNIRELSHVIERAVLTSEGELIGTDNIIIDSHQPAETSIDDLTLEQLERRRIDLALSRCDGKVGDAAAELGISRHALARRLEKFGMAKTE